LGDPQEKDKVLAEFPSIRKYRVRLIEGSRGKVLDIREFVKTETFEGFTRRGVRLQYPTEAEALAKSVAAALAEKPVPTR
jgi:hypothetical protein